MKKKYDYQEKGDPQDFAPDFSKTPEPYGKPIQEVLTPFSRMSKGSHVLDVAGGYGRYAIPLAKLGLDVTIVDMHQDSLDEALRRASRLPKGSGIIKVLNADVIREDFPSTKGVDAVLCIGFLHHLTNHAIENMINRMSKLLDKGGLLVIEISTNKDRRLPSGEPILVDGAREHNNTYEEGMELLKRSFDKNKFSSVDYQKVKLYERQENFWYDADMIIATATK